jgi:hypothetical protein
VQSEEGNDAQGKAQGGLRKFLRLKPSVFSGSANPFDAEDWLNEMNFEAMHCPHQDKVTLATFMLQCGAFHWWCNTLVLSMHQTFTNHEHQHHYAYHFM